MFRLFHTNRPIVYIRLLLACFIFKGLFLIHPGLNLPQSNDYLSQWLFRSFFISSNPLFFQLLNFFIFYLEAILFNFLLTRSGLFERQSFIPAFFYIVLGSLFREWNLADLHIFGSLLLLLSLFSLFSLTGQEPGKERIFYTALLLGLASLFWFPSAIFLVIIIMALILTRGFGFSDYLLVGVGFLLPFYFIGIGQFFKNQTESYFYFVSKISSIRPRFLMNFDTAQWISLMYMLAVAGLSYLLLRQDDDFRVLRHRRLWQLLAAYIFLILIFLPFSSGSRIIYLQALVLPCTAFIARIFDLRRPTFYHYAIFSIFLAGIIFTQLKFLGKV